VTPAPSTPEEVAESLVELRTDRFDLRRGLRGAALVIAPLIVGYALGIVEASVLVTLGALNLLLVEAPAPATTPWRTLALGSVANTLAFASGTVLSHAPFVVEAPLVGLGIFVAFLFTRWPQWENVGFIAAVMFVFSVGIPVTNFEGEALRPLAVLLGGAWAMLGISVYSFATSKTRATPRSAERPSPTIAWKKVEGHAAAVGAVVAIGLAVGTQLGLERDYWIMLTIIVALRFNLSATVAYSAARILGTIAGASVAFVVTDATQDPWILFPILAAVTALCLATRAVNYTLYAVWITLTVIVLLNLAYSGGPALAITRVVDTVIGGSLALLAAAALWITSRHRSTTTPAAV
jgi:uncharacterized membrane protein YccC